MKILIGGGCALVKLSKVQSVNAGTLFATIYRMPNFPTPLYNSRLGLLYAPDTLHYRESDLRAWLPEFRALGISWLTLVAPIDRAIPETFLRGLISENIEPVLHFQPALTEPVPHQEFTLLLEAYARWGVHYICIFDRPNLRASWPTESWAQTDLVERFLDIYLPLAEATVQAGLFPVFPPLEPGGDYWDTAFLRTALQAMERRGQTRVLKAMVLGAYAWADQQPLDWGAGGPERWPGARPYFTPSREQDQRGFRIFDWYLTLAQAVLEYPLPILLLGAGSRLTDDGALEKNLTIARLMANESIEEATPVPSEVLACNFWLLTAPSETPLASQAWYRPDGTTLPIIDSLRTWVEGRPNFVGGAGNQAKGAIPKAANHPIHHYLLIPRYEWGVADWHLKAIRPFIKKYQPTVGFSIEEAIHAARVTVLGGGQAFPEESLARLVEAGCQVERLEGTGMSIATKLATV